MAINRYRNVRIINNHNVEYDDIISRRGANFITHYSFNNFRELKLKDVPGLYYYTHMWTAGDRFFKIAHKYYGDSLYWWIIAYFNNTPFETDISPGENILVPTPLEVLISAMEI